MDAAQRMQRGTTSAPSGPGAEGMREQPAEHTTPLGQPPGQPLGATEHGPDLDAVATHVAEVSSQEDEIHRVSDPTRSGLGL
jgi:hypothetical protein